MDRDRHFDLPADRCYDAASHLWALRDASTGRVRVGVDAIGLESLGELAYVALLEDGKVVRRGEPLGSLEAAKMTTTIAAPLSGTIVGRNAAVLADPLAVNRDPYAGGWLVEIVPSRWPQEAALLVSGEAIGPWAAREMTRLRSEDGAGEGSC
jgi:glycine cleavage system H protein